MGAEVRGFYIDQLAGQLQTWHEEVEQLAATLEHTPHSAPVGLAQQLDETHTRLAAASAALTDLMMAMEDDAAWDARKGAAEQAFNDVHQALTQLHSQIQS